MGFVNPCQSWLGSWVGVFGLGLWCCPSFAGFFMVFVVGLWCRPAFGTCVVSCAFPLPPAVSGSGVRCGRACWARVSAVPRPSWLGCRGFFFALIVFFSRCWVSLSRALWSLPPSPFFRAGLLAFFFSVVCVCLFRCPFSRWAAVPGLVLPVLAGWSPCASFGGAVFDALWVGGLATFCVVGGRFGGWGCFRAAPPSPPLFSLGGGGRPGCSPLCLPSAGACSVAGVWCGWSLATPGGGSCVLLPATPGLVSLPVVVGGPRHSWLGSAGGSGVWCVVCGGGVLVGLWLVCGVVGPSPLLAEVRVCYSRPLLAGFRCRWWWAVTATPGWGPLAALLCGVWCVASVCWWGCGWCVVWLVPRHSWRRFVCATPRHSWLGFAAGGGGRSPPLLAGVRWRRCCVVCGVWRWCVGGVVAGVWCGWSLATPGGGSCVLLPATPGWVSLPVVLGGPRHSWLGSVGGVAVWCVVCGGGGLVGLWLVCRVVYPSPLLAEVPVCYSRPLLAGFWCRWWWAVPATPGWGPLAALLCGVWCVAVVGWWGCGWCVVWLVPRHSWRRFLCATPRHSWLGFAAGGGGRFPPLLAGVRWRRCCVVCGVWRWWVGGVVAGVCCGWSLASPGGGSCVLLPATPSWVSLPVVVGGPRHSWLGFCWRRWCVPCGVWCVAVVCCWGCGWCVVWLVPRHS